MTRSSGQLIRPEVAEHSSSTVPKAATWGLLVAFVVHDAEELATMPEWTRRMSDELSVRYPGLPPQLLSALRMSPAHAATAIGLVGAVVAAAAYDGARTGGRSAFYQTVLAGFGMHSVSHVGQSIAARGYTPGVVTAPLVVAPFSWWAWNRLTEAGVVKPSSTKANVTTALAVPALLVGAHLGAYGLCRLARRVWGSR